MEKRSESSHMDFEWQNTSGPVDPTSPWAKIPKPSPQKQQMDHTAKKRPHSVFDSPDKYATFPSLRDPAPSHTFLFSQSPAFTTPRKLEQEYASSEADATSSPDNNADSEATPDIGIRGGIAKSGKVFTHILDQGRDGKASAFGKLHGPSGRGDLSRNYYSHAIEKRVRRNRKRDADRRLVARRRGSASDSEEDTNEASNQTQQRVSPTGPGAVASLFGFIDTHPNLPHILSFYAQLTLNVFVVFFIIYLVYTFWATIRADVDKKSEEAIREILAEMAVCAEEYRKNSCESDTRPPALQTVCENWHRCMNKDPKSVGRARVSAHTFAEIFNSFIEPISWKAMFFVSFLAFGSLVFSNFAFYFFRNKLASHPAPPVPPTPSHAPPSYMATPHHQAQYWNGYASPLPPPSAAQQQQQHYPQTTMLMGREPLGQEGLSPTRKLQYY